MYQYDNFHDVASEAPEAADATDAIDQAPADSGASGRSGLTASFLAEIARAMRATAIQERDRISATVADTTVAHEQRVRDRATSEATELRRLANDDVERIETTTAAEIQRIKDDAERQVGERRGELADHLERHAALIETEIGRIHGAVDDYAAELDGFFGRLADEQNPAEIARLAGLLPEPPDLDQVGAMARADAVGQIVDEAAEAEAAEAIADEVAGEADTTYTAQAIDDAPEPSVVGVMAPEAGTPVFDDSGAPAEAEPVPAGHIAEDDPDEAASDADAASTSGISAAKLLRSLAPWATTDRPPDDPD